MDPKLALLILLFGAIIGLTKIDEEHRERIRQFAASRWRFALRRQ